MSCADSKDSCKTGKKNCPSMRCGLLVLALVAAVIVVAAILIPKITVQKIPAYIHDNISASITVGHADIGFFPPAIYLHDVRFKNPPGFTEGDALRIGRMVAHLDGFWTSPLVIRSITAQDISGTAEMVNEVDNFTPLLQDVMSRTAPPREGWASKPAIVETVMIRDARLKNPDGSIGVELGNANLGSIGSAAAPVTVHEAMRDSFKAVLAYEQGGIIKIMAKGVGDKMQEKWEGVKDALRQLVE